jgi:hypothetical protein
MIRHSDFLAEQFGGKKWVIARRTARIVERYGEDVVCVSQARYRAAEREWRALYGDPHDAVRAELYCVLWELEAVRPADSEHALWYRARAALRAEAEAR